VQYDGLFGSTEMMLFLELTVLKNVRNIIRLILPLVHYWAGSYVTDIATITHIWLPDNLKPIPLQVVGPAPMLTYADAGMQ
jgi:hypothetical protein